MGDIDDKNIVDLGDKKSYAGIPEAEFVVSFQLCIKRDRSLIQCRMILIITGRCRCLYGPY